MAELVLGGLEVGVWGGAGLGQVWRRGAAHLGTSRDYVWGSAESLLG